MAQNIYAKTEGECEAKLAARIGEMQAEIAVGKGRRNQGNQAGPGGRTGRKRASGGKLPPEARFFSVSGRTCGHAENAWSLD